MDQNTAQQLALLQKAAERAQQQLWQKAGQLVDEGAATQGDIARALGINQSTVSRRLDSLERKWSSPAA